MTEPFVANRRPWSRAFSLAFGPFGVVNPSDRVQGGQPVVPIGDRRPGVGVKRL